MRVSLALIFVLILGCSSEDSITGSSVNESTKEIIYSWAEDEKVAALRDDTEVNVAGDDQIVISPSKINKNYQYALRGFVSGDEVNLIQLYTISAFTKPLSKQDDWPNLDTATLNENNLDVTQITGQIECMDECDFYEHLGVEFSHGEFIELAKLDHALEIAVSGEDETKEYSIPNYYLKGFVLKLQEFLDKKTEANQTESYLLEMENLFLIH